MTHRISAGYSGHNLASLHASSGAIATQVFAPTSRGSTRRSDASALKDHVETRRKLIEGGGPKSELNQGVSLVIRPSRLPPRRIHPRDPNGRAYLRSFVILV